MMWKCLLAFLIIGVAASRAGYLQVPVSDVQKECSRFGGGDLTDAIREAMLTLDSCIDSNLDGEAISALQSSRKVTEDPLINVIRSVCNKKAEIIKCVSDFTDSMSPCMDPALRQNNKLDKRTLEGLVNYICENNAQKFSEFIKDDALSCFESQRQAIDSCLQHNPRMIKDKKYLINLYTEMCGLYKSVTGCLITPLSTCPKASTAQFFAKLNADLQKCTITPL